MIASTYRKKPVEIEAIRFTGWDNGPEVAAWCGGTYYQAQGQGEHTEITIETLEGTMTAGVGDWIIKGVEGEFYPCKNSIFQATYTMEETTELQNEYPSEPWDDIEREEDICSVPDCGRVADDDGFNTLLYIKVLISPGEEGYAEVTQCLCELHFETVLSELMKLGFKSHNHHGTNLLDAEDECGGYGKCQRPAEYGPELVRP